MSDILECTAKNIDEIDYSIYYQTYTISCKTDINTAVLLSDNNTLSDLYNIKKKLNNAKTKIDKHQLNISKKELNDTYGTDNLYELKNNKKINQNIIKQIKKNIFYDKITDKIYVMNFKYNIKTIFKIENVSNAGLKLTEILNHENLINEENTMSNKFKHFANAEMPGNFIVAVNYFIKTNYSHVTYDWYGNSLLPGVMGPKSAGLPDYYGYYKRHKERWIMDETKMNGDITNVNNIEYIKKYFENTGKCDLYTSDAGISLDIHDYNEQELIEIQLKLCEVLCALVTLKNNGNMVIKIYSFFEKATIDILIILSNLFKTFKIVKPMTSKPTNSENYIVGIDYIGYDNSLKYINLFMQKINDFNNNGYISKIDNSDLSLFSNIAKTIYDKQIIFINRNLYYFEKYYNESLHNYNIIKDIYNKYIIHLVNYYYEKYIDENNLKPLPIGDNL